MWKGGIELKSRARILQSGSKIWLYHLQICQSSLQSLCLTVLRCKTGGLIVCFYIVDPLWKLHELLFEITTQCLTHGQDSINDVTNFITGEYPFNQ